MRISIEEVEKMASLSMLYVSDEDKKMLQSSLESILSHAQRLNELDTENVEPTTYILKQQNVYREDQTTRKQSREELLRNAPEKEDGYFIVPQVVE
jgi:aspartyl-tRNA(Asn)/glutamyl-tRNA(Gln) amidotransferase subunit C